MPVPCLLLHLLLPPPPRPDQLAMHQGRRRYQEDRVVSALGLRIPFLAKDSQLAGLTVPDLARRGRLGNSEKMVLWVFGYGSLLWNPGFEFDEKIVGYIKDYKRVFDLACIDHRGTPENPARTCTLEAKKEEICVW